jgi:predicted Zn-dependent peptidase
MVVGLGGKVGDDAVQRLEELLGDLEPRDTGVPAPTSLNGDAGARIRVHTKQSDQAHLVVGVRSYPLGHPDRYVLQLLATVLGGGMSSRLFTEVRERRGLAYYVFGANHSYTDAGSLYSQAGVDINRVDDAVSTIVAELRKIADEPVPSDELEKARAFAKGRFVLQLESPHGTILFGLRREVLEGRAEEPANVLAGLDGVTAEDIQRVARDVLDGKALHLAVVGPFDDAERFEKLLAA